MVKQRYLHSSIKDDLPKKMVFLAGPRQVGKTTLAKFLGTQEYHHSQYFNWDNASDRRNIRELTFDPRAELVIFDELHKFRQWKNYIKGVFDTYREKFHILLTGSARLDLYRKGGDSLQGRYHSYRLHPFSVAELVGSVNTIEPFKPLDLPAASAASQRTFAKLLERGGFPEPLFALEQREIRRWRNERLDRLIKEDIRDIEIVRDLSALQVLSDILPSKVGSLLSLNALRNDLQVSHKTVALWMDILERFYFHFRIYPYASTKIKSLRKEPKLYLWDWSQVEKSAARFENIIASHLLKFIHYLQDAEGYRAELSFLRDVEGREVDFLVSVDGKPWFAVEVKEADDEISKTLPYFQERLRIPFVYQVVQSPGVDVLKKNTRLVSADVFLNGLI